MENRELNSKYKFEFDQNNRKSVEIATLQAHYTVKLKEIDDMRYVNDNLRLAIKQEEVEVLVRPTGMLCIKADPESEFVT